MVSGELSSRTSARSAGRLVLDFTECVEAARRIAFEQIDPALKSFLAGQGTSAERRLRYGADQDPCVPSISSLPRARHGRTVAGAHGMLRPIARQKCDGESTERRSRLYSSGASTMGS